MEKRVGVSAKYIQKMHSGQNTVAKINILGENAIKKA